MISIYKQREKFLKQFVAELQTLGSIKKIILFGSTASKNDYFTSDIDIAIIVDDNSNKKEIKKILNDISSKYAFEMGILFNLVVYAENEWNLNNPFHKVIHNEGRLLWVNEKT